MGAHASTVSDLQLEQAAQQGHVELLEQVALQRLLDFEPKEPFGFKKGGKWLLWEALEHGQGGVVQCLVRRSVASGEDFVDGWTVGHAAAFAGDLEALGELTEEQLHEVNKNGESLLHAAAWGGQVEAVQRLVELGADPNATTVDNSTCLHFAAWRAHVAVIEALVYKSGVDTVPAMDALEHLLCRKAESGDVDAIKRLVALGVDPDATGVRRQTALHFAAEAGQVEAIEQLLELRARPEAKNEDGETCMVVATRLGQVAVIEKLVGMDVATKPAQYILESLLRRKAANGDVVAIKQLVGLGVDPTATDGTGGTSLLRAALNHHPAATFYLLMMGVDPAAMQTDARAVLDTIVGQQHDRGEAAPRSIIMRVHSAVPVVTENALLPKLGPLAGLASFDVSLSRLNQVLFVWPQLRSLEVLCLRGLVAATFVRLESRLGKLSALRRLFLGGVEGETLHVSASQLATIVSLPLTALELSHVTFEDATALRGCTSLASLNLSSCTLSTADLDIIASLRKLQRLDLRGARFLSLDPLSGGCTALRSLDVRDCGLTSAPAFLASLPRLEQLFVLDNPFIDKLQEYRRLLADAASAVDCFRAQSLSSEGKTRDVPVVMVGHDRAGKSQVIRALLHAPTAGPGTVEHVPLVTNRTSMVESGVHALPMSGEWWGRTTDYETQVDEFEARFFDTPGQMEFFALNMAVIAPLFSNSVVLVVVRCVPHGVDGTNISLVAEKERVASEFRLWLAEVSRAVVRLGNGADAAGKSAKVLLVLTHRDVLEEAHGETAVKDVVARLDSLGSELRDEFSETLEVQDGIHFVNGTVASESGHGVAPLRERLATMAHGVFKSGPLLPGVLVEARALVVSEEVRRLRVCKRETLEELLTSQFGGRDLTPLMSQRLLEVLEANGSVLRTPGRQLVVVDPGWISRVMSSLYVDPKKHDAADFNGDPSEFDALAAFDEDGEVHAAELQGHLRGFVDGDDALLERLLLVLASHGIVIPLRVRPGRKGVPVVESYLIVGRWMDTQDGDGCVQWSSSRQDEASWFELVTGRPYSLQNAASEFALAPSLRDQRPSFHLTSLRCEMRVPLGPSFLTRLVHRLAQRFRSSRHSFLVRRTDFVCVLPFTRFHAALHVRLSSSANEFELTLVAVREDAAAPLQCVLRECVFHVLEMLVLDKHDVRLRVKQRCSACVATREDLTSHAHHDRELASGEAVRDDGEAVRALCSEVVIGNGRNWQYDECRGRDGALSAVEAAQVNPKQQPNSFGDSFVPDIKPASIKLNKSQVLGSGQFASVLMGELNGTEVVLKELEVPSPVALAEFEREAKLLGRASRYPCISLLLGMCRMGEAQVYLVMERAGVCDLEQALCKPVKKPLLGAAWDEFGVLLGLLADVASALRHMHDQDPPIVHNDVALRNVLVRHENGQNRAKLTDLGLACKVEHGKAKRLAPGTRVPKWQLAPETLESGVVSPASDVFQFGNLVYEMLARQRPFWRAWKTPGSKEEREVVRAAVVDDIKNGERPLHEDMEAAGAHCDDWLWQLAEECWRGDPLQRPTMVQVSARLIEYVRERGGVPDHQAPLGRRSATTQGPHYPKLGPQPVDDDDDSGDDDEEAKQQEADNEPLQPTPALPTISTAPPPAHVSDWNADDVCTWLLNLPSAACVELAPLFRHQGVKGTVLLALEIDDLTEHGVSRMTAKVLLQARDELLSPPE